MVYTLRFFSLQNAVCFIILTCLVPVLFTFYIQSVLNLKKNNSGAKKLNYGPGIIALCLTQAVDNTTYACLKHSPYMYTTSHMHHPFR